MEFYEIVYEVRKHVGPGNVNYHTIRSAPHLCDMISEYARTHPVSFHDTINTIIQLEPMLQNAERWKPNETRR